MICATFCCSLSTIGLGVPFGATRPSQTDMSSRLGRPAASASVGMFAIEVGERRSSLASARTLPLSTSGLTVTLAT